MGHDGVVNIDFNTITIAPHTGYGNVGRLLIDALENRAVFIQSGSDVMLNFCMPPDYHASKYTIGYTPWESTEVPGNWLLPMRGVDELWTTSSWTASVFSKLVKKKVWVLHHGIEDCWMPFQHKREDRPFTFLHVGEPAERKGGDIVLNAWHKAFAGRTDVKLIYKCIKYPTARVKDKRGSIIYSPGMDNSVETIGQVLSQEDMWELYSRVDCMVYPSRGEGFGLIPFEAMASGLPTILPALGGTGDFSAYSPLVLEKSMWVNSTAERIHPGLWLDHDVDELIEQMNRALNNFPEMADMSYNSALDIHQNFAWDRIAERAEDRLNQIRVH